LFVPGLVVGEVVEDGVVDALPADGPVEEGLVVDGVEGVGVDVVPVVAPVEGVPVLGLALLAGPSAKATTRKRS
jgi:hypothetical protein